jgi:hypothetical protein
MPERGDALQRATSCNNTGATHLFQASFVQIIAWIIGCQQRLVMHFGCQCAEHWGDGTGAKRVFPHGSQGQPLTSVWVQHFADQILRVVGLRPRHNVFKQNSGSEYCNGFGRHVQRNQGM